MAIMPAKTYHALKAAGAPEDDAIAAAEELAEYDNRFTGIEIGLAGIEVRLVHVEARLDHLENELDQFRSRVGMPAIRMSARVFGRRHLGPRC